MPDFKASAADAEAQDPKPFMVAFGGLLDDKKWDQFVNSLPASENVIDRRNEDPITAWHNEAKKVQLGYQYLLKHGVSEEEASKWYDETLKRVDEYHFQGYDAIANDMWAESEGRFSAKVPLPRKKPK